jgi:hypothetical protein
MGRQSKNTTETDQQQMGPHSTEARLHCTVGGHSTFEFWSHARGGTCEVSWCHGRAWNTYFVDRESRPVWPLVWSGWGYPAVFISAVLPPLKPSSRSQDQHLFCLCGCKHAEIIVTKYRITDLRLQSPTLIVQAHDRVSGLIGAASGRSSWQ